MTQIQNLPVDQLVNHPDNPRLQLREDVIERLVGEMKQTGFGPEHAILVRPSGGEYQIISGHHRTEAAKRADLAEVPAWVKEMDDDEAFMQLVLSNTQGELSPLEIGMHALKAVPLAQGKAGGGLKSYAARIGVSGEYVGQLRAAAEIIEALPNLSLEAEIGKKAKHLYEISKADPSCWPALVSALLSKGMSAANCAAEVDRVRKFEIPDRHAEWLPLRNVVSGFLKGGRLNPAAVARLTQVADGVLDHIVRDGAEEDRAAFLSWLIEHSGKESWDHKAISDYHADLIRSWSERREAEAELPDGIVFDVGDFRTWLHEHLEPGSVDAIVTDPPYPEEFLPLFADMGEVAAKLLKPGGICAVMIGQSYLPQIVDMLGKHLTYHWTLAYLTPGGQAVQLWQRKVNTFWKPILLYVNGEYTGDWLGDVTKSDVNDNDKSHHYWGQSESGMVDLVNRLTKPGQLVADPFLGGGTTAVVCHGLGRRFIGCDIDEVAVKSSKARFQTEER